MLRKLIFWLHLSCGVATGLVVLMMSVTGVILSYERQMLALQDRGYHSEPPAGALPAALETLLADARESGFATTAITVSSDPAAPVILTAGRSERRHVNPYTGSVHALHGDKLDRFFAAVTGWHRWFNVNGENRSVARAVTGASNLAFLTLILTGLYLWLPAVLRWRTLRMRIGFHPNVRSAQARDFNWHHVLGFWAALPLLVIVISGAVFNYSWANRLVYWLADDVPPNARPANGSSVTANRAAPDGSSPVDSLTLDELLAGFLSTGLAGDWKALTLSLPGSADETITLSVDQGNGGQPHKRHSARLDRSSGALVEWLPFRAQSTGRQARSWLRFLHTGEALGFVGQTLAGLASLAAVLMVWTGLSMSLRRCIAFLAGRRRIRRPSDTQLTADA